MRCATVIAIGLCLPALAGAETVSVTPSAGVVAQGGTATITVSVSPETNVQSVVLSYQNEAGTDQIWSSPYSVSHQFNTPQLNLTVTATVKHINGDPDTYATTTLSVVGLTLTGSAAPSRGWQTIYTVQSNPAGIPLGNVQYSYTIAEMPPQEANIHTSTFGDPNSDGNDKSTWTGAIIAAGTMSVSANVMGATPSATKTIGVTPRVWTTPITCAEDNEAGWGDPPLCVNGVLGANQDRDSNAADWIFVPRSSQNDFSSAMTFSQITSGPSSGWWYVSSSSLKCQRETVINRYIKANGPSLGGLTFQQANAGCYEGDFLSAVKHHEYRGTPPTPRSLEGHQGHIEYMIQDPSKPLYDPKMHIEGVRAWSVEELRDRVNDIVNEDEDEVNYYAGSEEDYATGPNWGFGPGSLGSGLHAGWQGSSWSGCWCQPSDF